MLDNLNNPDSHFVTLGVVKQIIKEERKRIVDKLRANAKFRRDDDILEDVANSIESEDS